MFPVDYQPLDPAEKQAILIWFASPGYRLFQEVLAAQRSQAGEEAIKLMGEGRPQDANLEQKADEVCFLTRVLDLLEAAAQGHHGEDDARHFPYLRMRATLSILAGTYQPTQP